MKIGIAQTNAVIGDFPGNAKRLLQAYRECLEAGAELVLTPELGLVGYPPKDLLFRSGFVSAGLQALDYLASEIGEVPLLVGYVDFNESTEPGRPFRNAAAFIVNGEVRERIWKSLLPNYDVFDEQRYFEPAAECLPVEWNGSKLGITICEDIWTEVFLRHSYYPRNPVSELVSAGADMILNISASPFHMGKQRARREMITGIASEFQTPIVYCNCVGANDELVFDGRSLAISSAGEVLQELPSFSETTQVINLDARSTVSPCPQPSVCECENLWDALVLGVRDYARKTGFQSACLGLSGGIDSALTAAVAAEALGKANVHGLTMPSRYSSAGSVSDSVALASNLGIRCDEIPIAKVFASFKEVLDPVFAGLAEDVTEENLQARTRGVLLMALANKHNYLLLTTGNKSELAVGYCTIYGDMCGGLAVISDLFKTKVFELCRWLNREREVIPWATIDKPPSAELRPDQRDQDTLPEYEVLDAILERYVEAQASVDDIVAEGFDEATVRWIQRRVDLNEWKRWQAAPGIRVTPKAFGSGRRMPIAHRFGG